MSTSRSKSAPRASTKPATKPQVGESDPQTPMPKETKPSRLDAVLRSSVSILIQGPGPIDAILPRLKKALPGAEWADLREGTSLGPAPKKDVVVLLGADVSTASRAWLEIALGSVRVVAVAPGVIDEAVRASFGTVMSAAAAIRPSAVGARP